MTDVKTQTVHYTGGGADMTGHYARDVERAGPLPGILVVHEWWGCNDYARKRAEMLAELGYAALAVDLYGGGRTADNPDAAGALMNAVIEDMGAGRERFLAGLEWLKSQPGVDAARTGAIGYCFGGGVVLHMARSGADLDVVASFHGSLGLVKAPGPEHIDCRVVAYNGAADPFVPDEDIEAFESEMGAVGAHWQLVQLPGTLHGFTNPAATTNGEKFGLPLKYSKLADQASWAHLQLVLLDVFETA